MLLQELLEVVAVKETQSGLELIVELGDGSQHEMDDYSYIMSIGAGKYAAAIVTGITALDDTLIIKAVYELDQDK